MVLARESGMERSFLQHTLSTIGRRFTEWLILWSLRRHFRAIYLHTEFEPDPNRGLILYANHHYWWDGYLGYAIARVWRRQPLAWMEAYRRFPPFGLLGALPFPPSDAQVRMQTIRKTMRMLKNEKRLFLLFPEGELHADEARLLPFQRSLGWLAKRLPEVPVAPLAITIRATYHQYPCAYLWVDKPLTESWRALSEQDYTECARERLWQCLQAQRERVAILTSHLHAIQNGYRLLIQGKLSAHERWQWWRLSDDEPRKPGGL